jgi:hypothetical protein
MGGVGVEVQGFGLMRIEFMAIYYCLKRNF